MKICGLQWSGAALAAALGVMLIATGCDTYYIPPPAVSISLTSPATSLVIVTTNSGGALVPATMQLQGVVANSPNQNIIYSVGVLGTYVQGGNNQWGTVDSTGVYTAPTVLPTPNTITVQAVAVIDPTQKATTTFTLLNQPANPTSLAPSVVTAGQTYTFDVVGNYFASGATINLSGAQLGAVQVISAQELKVTAQITTPGLLSLNVINPNSAGDTNAVAIRSQPSSPAASSSVAVLVGSAGHDSNGNAITATKAYVVEPDSLAVVNLDANKQIGSVVLPTGYAASLIAAHPAQNEVVVAGANSNILQLVSTANDQVTQSLVVPVATSVTVDGATCEICGMIVDSARNRVILDTAAGYFALNLADGTSTPPLAAPAAANFAYDPNTQRIYAPFSDSTASGVNVIDLVANTVSEAQPGGGVIYGSGADAGAFDPGTALLTVGDKNSGTYLSLNFNNATGTAGAVQVPASTFTVSGGCPGAWNGVSLDFTSHLGWLANLGGCVAVTTLPQAPASGAPGAPSALRWAQLPLGPDGLPWTNTPLGSAHTLAVYLGPDGRAYGLAVRQDSSELLKMDLALLQAANPVAGAADVNQVDPQNVTVNAQTVSAMVYIPLR